MPEGQHMCASIPCTAVHGGPQPDGRCVFLQVRALTHPNISLRPLALSRIAHLPLCLAVLAVLVHLFPVSLPAAAFSGPVFTSRMPADAVCAVFCMCALAICPRRSART